MVVKNLFFLMLIVCTFISSDEKKVAIIGSGPAGLSAAIYAGRAMHDVVLYTGKRESQLLKTEQIDNYLGAPEVRGYHLMELMFSQINGLPIECIDSHVARLSKKGDDFRVEDSKGNIRFYEAVIFATGSIAKRLHLDHEELLFGSGISTCALCDGNLYKGADVAVVGGGNSALEEALYLSRIVEHVYLVHRRDVFRGERSLQEAVRKKSNIILCMDSEVVQLKVKNGILSGIELKTSSKNQQKEIKVSGLFYAIGSVPNTQCLDRKDFKDIIGLEEQVIANKWGVVTEIPGFFVAGDVSDRRFSQAITAAGDGCKAALEMDAYKGQR